MTSAFDSPAMPSGTSTSNKNQKSGVFHEEDHGRGTAVSIATGEQERFATPDAKSFDVFLSHNSIDKAQVEQVAEILKKESFEPWFDTWCLTPGGDWQAELVQGLRASRCCAILVAPSDVGSWEREELRVALDRAAKDPGFRVFVVLLPGVPEP